jgi:hypothetical protein
MIAFFFLSVTEWDNSFTLPSNPDIPSASSSLLVMLSAVCFHLIY